MDPSSGPGEALFLEEDGPTNGSKTQSIVSHHLQTKHNAVYSSVEVGNLKKASLFPNSRGTKANRKKMKVDWTPELHKRFVQAVEQLGIDQAIPSRILELMKVEGLTRHNVASHLQWGLCPLNMSGNMAASAPCMHPIPSNWICSLEVKYRMRRRHIMPKEKDWRWKNPRDPMQTVYPHKPQMAFPPYHSNLGLSTNLTYLVWGHPSIHPYGVPMWGHPGVPMWQPPESWLWKTYPEMHADAWGCPVMPPAQGLCSTFPQFASGFHSLDVTEDRNSVPMSSFDLHPAEEVIDEVVKEAISKPWLPLPLGLKPPSTESVLKEIHKCLQ